MWQLKAASETCSDSNSYGADEDYNQSIEVGSELTPQATTRKAPQCTVLMILHRQK